MYHVAALYQYGVVADNIGPIDVEIFIYLLITRYIGQSVAVDDGHILIFALVYVEDKLRLVYGHKRIGHVGDQRSRSVVVGVTIEDDHGEVEARVRCGGSTAYIGEGKAGIGLRIICKPSDDVIGIGSHKGVHHFGYLSLLSQSRFRVFCRDGQVHYQAVFCRDVGSRPAVQLKRDVIVGDGVAIHIVGQVVLGLLKPDGGVSLIYGYLDNLRRRNFIVGAAFHGDFHPIAARVDYVVFFKVHIGVIPGVFGERDKNVYGAHQRRA